MVFKRTVSKPESKRLNQNEFSYFHQKLLTLNRKQLIRAPLTCGPSACPHPQHPQHFSVSTFQFQLLIRQGRVLCIRKPEKPTELTTAAATAVMSRFCWISLAQISFAFSHFCFSPTFGGLTFWVIPLIFLRIFYRANTGRHFISGFDVDYASLDC